MTNQKSRASRANFDPAAFYGALDAARQSRGLQWKQVAEQAGVSASTLTRIAQGKRPDIDGFFALAAWSGIDPNDLVGEKSGVDPVGAATATLFKADPNLSADEREALKKLIVGAYDLATRGRKK